MGIAGGPDIIQNGLVFSLDASDRNSYTIGNGTELVTNSALLNPNDGQTATVSRTASNNTIISGLGTMTSGSYYVLKYIVTQNTGSTGATFRIGGSAGNLSPTLGVTPGATGSYSAIFQALSTEVLTLNGDNTGVYMVLDYISVQQLSNTWFDLSGNNRNETLANTSFNTNNNGAIFFNGTNSSGSYAGNPITGSSAFTLSGWMNLSNNAGAYQLAVSIGNAAADNAAYIGYVSTAQSGSSNSIGGGFYGRNFGSGVAVNTGWHNVVFSYAGGANALATLYVDGTARVSGTQNPNLSSTVINLGASNTGTGYWCSGSIANVQLYNRALPLAEIQQNYNVLKTRFGL
jgi:hypothetical protein